MKKILFIVAIFAIAFSVSACTSKNTLTGEENLTSESTLTNEEINLADNLNTSALESNPVSNDSGETPAQNNTNMQSPDQQEDLTKKYSQAILKTNLGDITVKFYADESPITVNNFLNLAQSGFYNGVKFHRVIKDFMIQGGDPLSKESNSSLWGTGGPGYQFKDEINTHKLVLGSLAMANAGAGTNGSQFFIVTLAETPWLDGKHTNFGQVTDGMDVVKKIESVETGVNDRPIQDVVINSIELVK